MMETQEFQRSPEMEQVVQRIVAEYHPLRIYLYSHRVSLDGELGSFKLCIVMDTGEKLRVEQEICLSIDCDIPYDVLIYTPDEWTEISEDPYSFAGKIRQTGAVIYDQV